ncbi:MAG: D-aminoacylase [Fimbriimonadaceae bacterium]|nr:D-aminoacylase [Fimbriimonadaceae bacterium]QYK58472.1 MAG: D-aminoacylase [Fimbriimonadaceae bacterium]
MARALLIGTLVGASVLALGSTLLQGGTVFDGSGRPPRAVDVRFHAGKIIEVGRLKPRKGEAVIDVSGLWVAPGFIDAHSHADRALDKLESQLRQGVTTAIVGQDGFSDLPLSSLSEKLRNQPTEINFASFSGHNTIRAKVLGDRFQRRATALEVRAMARLVDADMAAGALGLSTGLEYDPGHYASLDEIVALARVAARRGGIYVSHVRDEGPGAIESFQELLEIGKRARIPVQVSHIKLAASGLWGRAGRALAMFDRARRDGVDVTADVYPYLFWQSTITALTASRAFDDPATWRAALDQVGGPESVTITACPKFPDLAGKNLAEAAVKQELSPEDLIIKLVQTADPGASPATILCKAMSEDDLAAFWTWPWTMGCSDGIGGGSHPRGAGAFPRLMGLANDRIPTGEAVRKLTSLPAWRFGLNDRGRIRPGSAADIIVIDPKRLRDLATPDDPTRLAEGVVHVIVNGWAALRDGQMTGAKPGRLLRLQRGLRRTEYQANRSLSGSIASAPLSQPRARAIFRAKALSSTSNSTTSNPASSHCCCGKGFSPSAAG